MDDNLKKDNLKSILIVESIEDEVRQFIDVVQNNCDAIITSFTSSIEAVLWLQTNYADVVILEEHLQPMGVIETTEFIKNELHQNIPVFISTRQNPAPEDKNLLQKPFTYDSLQKLCRVNIECKTEASNYSLQYLKEVSDGNMDFVISSIEIFQTSVTEQITKLESASYNKDYKQIGEIAHHIKPSFEMLLNHEAAAICNKLIYKPDPEQVSSQIEELKGIFGKIKKELETDFSQNNM